MASKTDTEVIIGGKVFTLSGYESEEYLQKVASYINNKVNEYSKVDSFRRQPLDTQGVLLQLNIADDYFKAKKQIALLEEELQRKEKELYDLKHELISSQIKMENMEKDSREMEIQLRENAKQIERLEKEHKNNCWLRRATGKPFTGPFTQGQMPSIWEGKDSGPEPMRTIFPERNYLAVSVMDICTAAKVTSP